MVEREIYHRSFTFGTWNVRGLTEKKQETFAEIERENKDVVVLTETKLRGSGKEEYPNYIHVYSGVRVGAARAGVSVLVKKEFSSGMRWKVVNERIIRVRLKVGVHKIVVLGVYWVDDCAKTEVKDRFQTALCKVLKNIKITDEIVILGDFNAWVGTSISSRAIGRFGEEKMNNNGRRLIDVCEIFHLKILNTFFDHEDMHKYTWYDKRSNSKSIIDYCIVRQDTILKFVDVIACRWLECGTDHIYLEAVAIFSSIPPPKSSLRMYNSYLLFSETIEAKYKEHLDRHIILNKYKSTADLYQHFKEVIHSAATDVLGIDPLGDRSEFLWDEELRKLRCKRKEYNIGINYIYHPKSEVKIEVWKGICKAIEKIPKQFQRNKVICNILKEFQNQSVTTLTADKEFLEIYFKNYFKECRPEFIGDLERCIGQSGFSIFPADIIQALNEFEDFDVPSPGGISMRLLKHGSNNLKKLLKDLIQAIFDGHTIPEEINEMFFIYHSGDEKLLNLINCSKCVSHTVMQVMSAIIKNFIEKSNAFKEKCKLIHEESCLDATFVLRMLLQKCADKQNKPLHLVFINLEEAFLDVPRIKMFNELQKLGIEDSLVKIVKHLYKDNTVRMIFSNEISKLSYPVSKGLKKNCALSPTLFNVYIRRAVKDWLKENDKKGFPVDTTKMFSFLSEQTNLVVLSDSLKHLGSAIESLLKHLGKLNLQISFKNIKYLGITEDDERELMIGKRGIVSEDCFEFLGSVLEVGGRNDIDINNRIISTKNAIGVLHSVARDKRIDKDCKKRIYHAIINNSLTFSCETWTMTEKFMSRLLRVEMSYWRWCCENYPQHFKNDIVLEIMEVDEVVDEAVKLKRSAWFAKVKMTNDNRWSKCVLEWNIDGKSKPGRRKRWIEGIEDFINELSLRQGFVIKNKHLENIVALNRESHEDS
ncbi:LINE-1 retrotransposable element ORF2 protein [Parasteatoda tepidariorum]|uniref:LINE-1 retrotransposable element ORF2 protein n=1 Tax=Parasteatoda tepidariorum TaxID=114398 RepID=UPI00077FAFCC|nr:uncharacterized protein LOC107451950 [Parasteatoda tepidariorum]